MLKLLLKHTILDFALNVMFGKIEENINIAPITSLIGKSVVIKLTDKCMKIHDFSSNYQHGVVHDVSIHEDGFSLSLLNYSESGLTWISCFEADEIVSIR